jgi:hypothetical protein
MSVFRLTRSRTDQEFRGVVAIFDTPVQEVWQCLTTTDGAAEIPFTVGRNDVERLRAELEALEVGSLIEMGPSLLWQIMSDPAVTGGARSRFTRRERFPLIARTNATLKLRVEREFQREERSET